MASVKKQPKVGEEKPASDLSSLMTPGNLFFVAVWIFLEMEDRRRRGGR